MSTSTLLGGPPVYSLTEQTWLFFGCAGGPGPVAAPLPPLQAAPVQAGRSPGSLRGGKCIWHAELGIQGGQSRKGGTFSRGSPQEAAEGPRLRLADRSSSRYAGRLVPHSLEGAAATTRLQAWPYRRSKQLLCKQTKWHRPIQEALHVSRELLSGAQQDLKFTERW